MSDAFIARTLPRLRAVLIDAALSIGGTGVGDSRAAPLQAHRLRWTEQIAVAMRRAAEVVAAVTAFALGTRTTPDAALLDAVRSLVALWRTGWAARIFDDSGIDKGSHIGRAASIATSIACNTGVKRGGRSASRIRMF